jgi:DNA-binding GntR family transcriptional regulator
MKGDAAQMTAQQPMGRRLTTGPTLGDQAYEAIRAAITGGELVGGERMTERDLARRLGVSPTPVREALKRLEDEALIRRRSSRGVEVAKPSHRELYELTTIEAALRGVAARLAAEVATAAELKAMESAVEAAEKLVAGWASSEEGALSEKVLRKTREFHALLDRAAHNPLLERMIATATAFDWDFRLRAAESGLPDSKQSRMNEHRLILEAVQNRDGLEAERLMRRHILAAAEAFLAAST